MLRVLYHGIRNDARSHDNVHALVLYNTYHGDLHVETPSSAVKIEHYEVYYELNGAAKVGKWIEIFIYDSTSKIAMKFSE